MSGVLRFHDLTYKLIGAILHAGLGAGVWTAKKMTSKVLSTIDKKLYKELIATGKSPDNEIRRLVYYSRQRGYLDSKLHTTKAGAAKLTKLQYHTLSMTQPWDRRWRIVMYDIPNDKNSARDQIRRLIKQLGFVQLQQSVWIHPLPCLEQFNEIKEANGLEDSLVLIETSNLPGANKHWGHFRQLYPKIKF